MKSNYVITVTSLDRVGIIAAVSEAVSRLEGSIDALSQTVMSGYFTLILTVHFEERIDTDALKRGVKSRGKPGELDVIIRKRGPDINAKPEGAGTEKFILTLTGTDKKGVVRRVSSYLAGQNINIEDLYARVDDGRFLMIAELQVPATGLIAQMQSELGDLWRDENMSVSLQHENIFLATNQVDFSPHPG